MKKQNYLIAAGVALTSAAVYYFLRRGKSKPSPQPLKESERHHLTNAFARAKQVAVGKS
jgi:LPXTG-motif cell wall-anchored protein